MNEMGVFLKTNEGKEVMKRQEKKMEFVSDPRAIYQDHFVSVRSDYLIVKKYFFPSQLPYDFPWDHIHSITFCPQSHEDKSKVPEKGDDEEGRWWAIDVLRPEDRQLPLFNIRIEADADPPKSGFTVERIEQFITACRPFLPYSCSISYEKEGEEDYSDDE